MPKPDLKLLVRWLDPTLVSLLETKRLLKKEWQRHRKLATLETLWLMLAVSLDTQRSSLYEILRLATGNLNLKWSISVAAFCKARARFSPGGLILDLWLVGFSTAKYLQRSTPPLARFASLGRGQNHSGLARVRLPL